jgi:hypothetical protein
MVSANTTQNNGAEQNSAPTLSERLELACLFQRQALAGSDPLVANLRMIGGDLMKFVHILADQVQKQLTQGAMSEETRRRFLHDMDLYLKLVRQSDRLAQIERQLGSASRDKSHAP